MATQDISNFLSTVTADYDYTLTVSPHEVITEDGSKTQVVHMGDDGSEERISLSDTPIFYTVLNWKGITNTDAATIMDLYFNTDKANGIQRSFKWTNPIDSNTYVVRFDTNLKRDRITIGAHRINSVRLRILGNA